MVILVNSLAAARYNGTMKPKIDVLRALSAVIARRALRVAVVLAVVIAVLLFGVIWLLAAQLSTWWWLLLIIYLPLVMIGVGLGLLLRAIITRLQPRGLSHEERSALEQFADKLQRMIELRGLRWPALVMLSIKDMLLHRDLTTIRSIVRDTTSLRQDLRELEARFTTRD